MPYFAIGGAIHLEVIFSFIYRINDQKLIGCLHHTFLSTPSSVTQWDLSLKGGHPVVATGRISSRTVVTVRRRQSNLLLGSYTQTRPSMQVLETCDTRLQLIVNDTYYLRLAYFGSFHSCNVILLLCILIADLSIRFNLELLRITPFRFTLRLPY